MPANDSARARAERRERQEQRSQEVQPQAQQLEEEVQGQLDQDGDEEMPNVKSEVFEEVRAFSCLQSRFVIFIDFTRTKTIVEQGGRNDFTLRVQRSVNFLEVRPFIAHLW